MPIVIKEIIVRTTVEKAVKEVSIDEKMVRKIEQRVLTKIQEEETPRRRGYTKNR